MLSIIRHLNALTRLLSFSLALCFVSCGLQRRAWQPTSDGLAISILGDSYSTFEGEVEPASNAVWYYYHSDGRTDCTHPEQTWWRIVAGQLGGHIDTNNSFSGSTISSTGYNGADYSDRSFVTRLTNVGNPDILFVFGATNDSWAGSPLGDYKYEGQTEADLKTFRPAMALLLSKLKELHPHAKIYFILNSELKDEINTSVKSICKYYSVTCIELHDIGKISGHPSVAGHRQIAEQVVDVVRKQ